MPSVLDSYFDLQKEYELKYGKDTVVAFQWGTFYEFFQNETLGNAEKVANICNAMYYVSNKFGGIKPYTTGFPKSSLAKNLPRLLENNMTVVVVDESEQGRNVTSVISPGTYTEEFKTTDSNNIVAIYADYEDEVLAFGVAVTDLSTGCVSVEEVLHEDHHHCIETLYSVYKSHNPRETVVYTHKFNDKQTNDLCKTLKLRGTKTLVRQCVPEFRKPSYQNEVLAKVYPKSGMLAPVQNIGMEKYQFGLVSLISLLQFCYEHNEKHLLCINEPKFIDQHDKLSLHNNASEQLNVLALYKYINKCSTAMGNRLLKSTILSPRVNPAEIREMLTDVESMIPKVESYENKLKHIKDLERMHKKLEAKTLAPEEFGQSMLSYESVLQVLEYWDSSETESFRKFMEYIKDTYDVLSMQDTTKSFFKKGVFHELDDLQLDINNLMHQANVQCELISDLIKGNKNKTCFVKFENNTFYATPSKAELIKQKKGYKVFKDTKTKSRITSDLLEDLSDKMSRRQDEIKPLIEMIYEQTLDHINTQFSVTLNTVVQQIAYIDTVKSKARVAIEYDYSRPSIIDDTDASFIDALQLRHALLERLENETEYIPNDVKLDTNNTGLLLYGVNGSGKSCYSKAIGLAIILAQSGHYVPAEKCSIAPFTKLYTRTTCDDDIFKGHSSFIVEMVELKSIIKFADAKSIVIGDEVCKGTEDVSAISIVGAAIRWLLDKNVKFVFATHLHKLPALTLLEKEAKLQIKHISIDLQTSSNMIIFTRVLMDGQGSEKYGLEIAQYLLQDKEFIALANSVRNEVEKRNKFLVSTKTSRYNSNVIVDRCQICGSTDNLDNHHIIFQRDAPTKRKNKENLVVLCESHHNAVHRGELNVKGWVQTSTGKMLSYTVN